VRDKYEEDVQVSEELDNVIPVDFGKKEEEPKELMPARLGTVVKAVDQEVTIEILDSLIGKRIYVPTNVHMVAANPDDEFKAINVWFAGTVGGYEIAKIKYNAMQDTFFNDVKVSFNVLLTDGVVYQLSSIKCEILELTEDEFLQMVKDFKEAKLKEQAKQALVDSILLPGRDFNL
jgi:hypothetical protein